MRNLCLLMIALCFQSCQVYNTSFDCPPGRGIPCRSVSAIESMIVETEKGPDVIVEKNLSSVLIFREPEFPCREAWKQMKRVWIAGRATPSGSVVEDHYIFFQPEEDEGGQSD